MIAKDTDHMTNGKIILSVITLFIISRLFIYFLGYIAINLFPNYTIEPKYSKVQQVGYTSTQLILENDLNKTRMLNWDDLNKFDSHHYLNIAQNGYDKPTDKHGHANWVFFPSFPVLIALVSKIALAINPVIIGTFLSNVFLVGALFYIALICRERELVKSQSQYIIFLLLIYPTSVFYSVPYTESLFLLLSSASIYYTVKRRYFLAFLLGGLAGVTRIVGFVNILFAIGHYLFERKFKLKIKDLKLVGYTLFSFIPLMIFFAYMKKLTGDYLAPLHEQANWDRGTTIPFTSYFNFIRHPYFVNPSGYDNGFLSFVFSTIIFIIFIYYLIKNYKELLNNYFELLFFLYGALMIVIPFSSAHHMVSVIRYSMVCIPLYFYIAKLGRNNIYIRVIFQSLFFITQTIITICYFNDYNFVV